MFFKFPQIIMMLMSISVFIKIRLEFMKGKKSIFNQLLWYTTPEKPSYIPNFRCANFFYWKFAEAESPGNMSTVHLKTFQIMYRTCIKLLSK